METSFAYNEKAELLKAKERRRYENKQAALVHEKVIASGETTKETAEEAENAGYKDGIFYLVPFSSVSYALHYLELKFRFTPRDSNTGSTYVRIVKVVHNQS